MVSGMITRIAMDICGVQPMDYSDLVRELRKKQNQFIKETFKKETQFIKEYEFKV